MATRAAERWTFEDYFAWEATQDTRHEFIDGEVFAMTGGTERHALVIVNLITALRNRLRGERCRVFSGDVKIHVEASGKSYYPDAFICCDRAVVQERGVATDATAIFEVLSPSTALFDLGGKFAEYRRLTGLRHYVLIDPEALAVEVFELIGGRWTIVEAGGDDLRLDAANVVISKAELFEDVGEARAPIGTPSKTARPASD